MAPPEFYSDMVDLLPPPLDFGDHFLVDPEPMKQNSYSDDESSLNRSIFEFSDADLSFDDLSNNFAGRMHFWVHSAHQSVDASQTTLYSWFLDIYRCRRQSGHNHPIDQNYFLTNNLVISIVSFDCDFIFHF